MRLRNLLGMSTSAVTQGVTGRSNLTSNSTLTVAILGALAALPALSIDISAPTLLLLPLHLGTSAFVASLSLSLFMVGFALGQFTGGRVSDRIGRRPILLNGLACFTIAGVACALSTSAFALATFRLIQGVGAGMCSVLSFAMVQDLYDGDTARTKRSSIIVIVGLIPLLAPALGSVLISIAGWRSVHSILAVGGSVLLLTCWLLTDETKSVSEEARKGAASEETHRSWLERGFLGIGIANALSYGCIFAYIAGSPVVIMGQMGLSSTTFAAAFASTAAALSAGAWTSGRLTRRGFSAQALLSPSLALAAAASLGLAALFATESYHSVALLPLMMTILFARGIIAPNLQHLAIERRKDKAGTASAIIGLLQLSGGALASVLVGALMPHLGPISAAAPIAVLATSALLVWCWVSAEQGRARKALRVS